MDFKFLSQLVILFYLFLKFSKIVFWYAYTYANPHISDQTRDILVSEINIVLFTILYLIYQLIKFVIFLATSSRTKHFEQRFQKNSNKYA